MKLPYPPILFATAVLGFAAARYRTNSSSSSSVGSLRRALASSSSSSSTYYYEVSDVTVLGSANPDAAVGNPLKGLFTSPRWTGGNTTDSIPSTLEFYYIGLDEIMVGNNQFDWSFLDATLADAASRYKHVIWRVFCHFPGSPLRVPQYLIDAGTALVTTHDGSLSPQYDDPILLQAFKQFIAALGQRYDGHTSLGFIQLGLLGYWGEWHTFPDQDLLSDATKDKVVGWYAAAFKTTQLQTRGPMALANAAGMGLHDDSFAYSTLGSIDWFFYPQVERAGQTSFWKTGAMGGETRPELQATVFEPGYQANSDAYKQDFMQCVETTHASFLLHHGAFENGGLAAGPALQKARHAHARLGYNFHVTSVGVAATGSSPADARTVSVGVTVQQIGVAPFYYPLHLALTCAGGGGGGGDGATSQTVGGVHDLIEAGAAQTFTFANVPATAACLESVEITLQSPHAYGAAPGRRLIKLAQGDGIVRVRLPAPPSSTPLSSSSTAAPAVPPPPTTDLFLDATALVQHGSPRFVLSTASPADSVALWSTDDPHAIATINGGGGIAGYDGDVFRRHIWAPGSFTVTLLGLIPKSTHQLVLGFAETYPPNCAVHRRVFSVVVHDDSDHGGSSQPLMDNVDVYAQAGCDRPFVTAARAVTATVDGTIQLSFVATPGADYPFVSFIDLRETAAAAHGRL